MDVENANCKLRISQCTDLEISPIERPLKIDQEITGLQKLLDELHKVFSWDHVNVQDVQKLMAGYKSDPKDWRKYAKFDRYRYTRNLVDAGNGAFNIMVLCWGPGHASAIHDHADSHCFMKMLSGNLEEVRYDWPEKIQPDIVKKIRRGRCCSESMNDVKNKMSDINFNCDNETNHSFVHQNGTTENGHCNNGTFENGQFKNGGFENGHFGNGGVENGHFGNGGVENGHFGNGGVENGHFGNGGVENGHFGNGGVENGHFENGGVENGHFGNGGVENGHCENGGVENAQDENEVDCESVKEIGRTRLDINDVCYINDALGLHRVENPSHVDGAVSLHLYCPPFDSCRVFDARTGKPTQVKVTFWSEYGKKVKRVIEANKISADSQ